jgi:ABC-type bacteriocin/lantibiotic exporter with double-glycine peptidase domain
MSASPIGAILRPHRRLIVVAALAMVAATAITLTSPILAKIAIDRGINGHDPHVIDVIAVVFLILVLMRPALERIIVVASARAGERFSRCPSSKRRARAFWSRV